MNYKQITNKYNQYIKELDKEILNYSLDKVILGFEIINNYFQKNTAYKHLNKEKIILVAGTNGKGSTCITLESLLRNYGFKTGLFTSPHLIDIKERIRINNKNISKTNFVKFYQLIHDEKNKIDHNLQFSFFETLTLIAYAYFYTNETDFAIFEIGIGGLLDATNIIPHKYAVITSISMDHMNILGRTFKEVSYNKFGIITPDVTDVFYTDFDLNLKNLGLYDINHNISHINNNNTNNSDFHNIHNNNINYDISTQKCDVSINKLLQDYCTKLSKERFELSSKDTYAINNFNHENDAPSISNPMENASNVNHNTQNKINAIKAFPYSFKFNKGKFLLNINTDNIHLNNIYNTKTENTNNVNMNISNSNISKFINKNKWIKIALKGERGAENTALAFTVFLHIIHNNINNVALKKSILSLQKIKWAGRMHSINYQHTIHKKTYGNEDNGNERNKSTNRNAKNNNNTNNNNTSYNDKMDYDKDCKKYKNTHSQAYCNYNQKEASFDPHEGAQKAKVESATQQTKNTIIYFSGDHNLSGIISLINLLKYYTFTSVRFVTAFSCDKEFEKILNTLSTVKNSFIYLTQNTNKPIESYNGLEKKVYYYNKNYIATFNKAVEDLRQDEIIIVTGSLYLVGGLLKYCKENNRYKKSEKKN